MPQHLLVATEYLGRASSPRAEAESTVALAKMNEAVRLRQPGRIGELNRLMAAVKRPKRVGRKAP